MSLVDRLAKSSRHTLFIVLGAEHIECGVMRDAGTRAQWIEDSLLNVAISAADGDESLMQALTAALQRLSIRPALPVVDEMRVVVSDHWLATTGMPWSPSVKRTATAEPYARAQLAGAGFEIGPADTLKLDDAPFGVPFLAVAYPATLLTALDQLAGRLNTRLTSILPLSVAAWAVAQRKGSARSQALVVLDAGLMMLARGTGLGRPRLCEVTLRVNIGDCVPTDQSLRKVWLRMCLRDSQLAGMQHVALLDLTQPGTAQRPADKPFVWVDLPSQGDTMIASPALRLAATACFLHDVLDALPCTPTLSPGRWLVLGVTALLAGAMVVQALQTNVAMHSITARLNAAMSAVQPAPHPTTWSREEIAQVQAVNVAIRELNLPISPILHALEPPRDIRVAVLSVETTGRSSTVHASSVKIVAEARTGEEMARYVAFVAESKPFTGAYLIGHEIDQASIELPYRFTVEASWSE